MRTQEEIQAKARESSTFFGFEREVYVFALDFEGDDSISDKDCLAAIQLIREAASSDLGRELEK